MHDRQHRRLAVWPLSGLFAAALHLLALDTPLSQSPPPLGRDGIFFAYVGQSASRGALPYQHVWDIKPPLIHAVATGLATITQTPMELYYASVTLMILVGIASTLVIAAVAVDVTDDDLAGFTAGLSWLAFSTVIWLPARGLRPKPIVVLFGVGALLALRRDRPLVAVAGATVAAGMWQLALIFPVTVGAVLVRRYPRRVWYRAVGIATAIVVLTVGPYLRPGALTPMLVQVLLGPAAATESTELWARVVDAHDMFGLATAVVVCGAVGLAARTSRHGDVWPLTVAGGWYLVQVALLDFDGAPDLVVFYAVAAVGAGVLVNRVRDLDNSRPLFAAGAVVLLLAVAMAVLSGPIGGSFTPSGRVAAAYWNGYEVGCHAQQSRVERRFMAAVDAATGAQCGPYSVEDVRALLGQ